MKGENYLLSIAIDKYSGPRYCLLNNARHDAERLRGVLEHRYGFKLIRQLYDEEATRENIINTLDSLAYDVTQHDNLIIHFVGHGDQHPTSKQGFWVPYNGETASSRIMNSSILDAIEAIQAKHILLISDSCYSGTFITRARGPQENLTFDELEALDSRWVFASCGEETAWDGRMGKGSPFGRSLCEFFDTNQSEIVSAGEVFEAVSRATNSISHQTPQAEQIKRDGNKGGQMIFRLHYTRGGTLKPVEPLPDHAQEIIVEKPAFPLPVLTDKSNYIIRSVTYYEYQQDEIAYFFQQEHGKIQLSQAISTHKRIVLLGSAGSGKSVELIRLAEDLSQPNVPTVPIYKRFNIYTGQDIECYLPEEWKRIPQETLVLLFDGLDEIQSQYFLTSVKKLLDFCNRYPKIRIVVSCRTNFYDLPTNTFSGTLEGFAVYTLDDISLHAIQEYSTNSLGINGHQFIEDIYEASYLDLVNKPYFLHLLTTHYIDNGDFPSNRSLILEQSVSNYFTIDREHFKNADIPFTKKEALYKLEKIAYIMEVMGKNYLSDDELQELFPLSSDYNKVKYLPTFKKRLVNDQWMFEHNNIQEYLASRVLAKKNQTKLIETISLSTGGHLKIKPTWVNTLSFLISIGEDDVVQHLLDWIIQNDIEVLVKFEPDRISKQKRIEVFKKIFDFYSSKQIWLSSNKFTDNDLARFGYYSEIIEYLLEKLQDSNTPRITKFNSLRILDNFKFSDFDQYKEPLKNTLIHLLDDPRLNQHDIYYVLGAMAKLHLSDETTVADIVAKFRNRKNQYIRAGLYQILHTSDYINDYPEILIEGLDLSRIKSPIEDRDPINLMDEEHHLKIALQNISEHNALIKIVNYFSEERTRDFYISDYRDIVISIIQHAISIYTDDRSIYIPMRDFYIASEKFYEKGVVYQIQSFFKQTNTIKELFTFIWRNEDITSYHKTELLEVLLDEDIVKWFIELYQNLDYTNEDIQRLHQLLLINQVQWPIFKNYIKQIEDAAISNGFIIEKPEFKDWNEINKKRTQASFDLIFKPAEMLKEVNSIFSEMEKKTLTHNDIFNYQTAHNRYLDEAFLTTSVQLLRGFTLNGNAITFEEVQTFVNSDDLFLNYQIHEIHDYLTGSYNQYIELTVEQIEFIRNWCILKGNYWRLLWFFIHRFEISLPENKILELTLYYDFNAESKLDDPGTIEQLGKFVSKDKLNKRVIENIKKGISEPLAWIGNAGYAIRNNLLDCYPIIIKHMERESDNEYKFNDVLELWYKKSKNSLRLASFIQNTNSEILRWKAIDLLHNSKTETDFLKTYLNQIINDNYKSLDNRFSAANYLMKMNNLDGLIFATNYILEHKDPSFDFRHLLKNMPQLTTAESLPFLMKLLHLGKQKEFQKDTFNKLESLVIDTIYRIGIESDKNFALVRTAITEFINANNSIIENLNFLYFTVARIEQQLNMNESRRLNIYQAIEEWERSM
jgi:hypothetical protein